MLLHLLPRATWRATLGGQQYIPDAYESDGFVHCSGSDAVMLAVANAYYAGTDEELVVLSLDEALLTSEVRWEAPDPAPPPGVPTGTRFPHVYGPLDLDAVVRVRRLVRLPSGEFTGYGPLD
jgi:uncharacterized protein